MIRRLSILLLLSFFAGVALADSPQNGTIDGTVVDASGTALPGVTVTLGSERGDKSTVTDEAGKFLFGLLPPGQYTLGASLEGFDVHRDRRSSLETGQRQSLELRLGLGTSEEIAVVAETPMVDKYQVSAGDHGRRRRRQGAGLHQPQLPVADHQPSRRGAQRPVDPARRAHAVGQRQPVAGERRLRRRRRHHQHPLRRRLADDPAHQRSGRGAQRRLRLRRRVRARGRRRHRRGDQVGHQHLPRRLPVHRAEPEVGGAVRRRAAAARGRHHQQLRGLDRRADPPRQALVLRGRRPTTTPTRSRRSPAATSSRTA